MPGIFHRACWLQGREPTALPDVVFGLPLPAALVALVPVAVEGDEPIALLLASPPSVPTPGCAA
ncbi:MAG TPA: hypothetical protein VGD76_09545, partial [Ramlibacter sp.]